MRYIFNLLISIDQLANTLLGGDPDMTISRRMGLWKVAGGWRYLVARFVCSYLNQIDENHCEDAKE
jgi:hypothetical protein